MDLQMDQQADCQLAKMPLEIILRISSWLTTPELGALRRSCKLIERALFNAFSREFFQKKQFMLTDRSLRTLVDISRHPNLAPCIERLIIGLDRYDHSNNIRFSTVDQAIAYRKGAADQFNLTSTGRAQSLLAEALRGLPNLTSIDIRDYNNGKRFRDGPGAKWTSYGATTVHNETGQRLHINHYLNKDFLGTTFGVALAAMASAGVQMPNFEVILKSKAWGLPDYVLLIPEPLRDSYSPVLAGFKKLHLDVDLTQGQSIVGDTTGIMGEVTHTCGLLLKKFLLCTTNLTWLRLNLQGTMSHSAEAFFGWLGAPVTDPTTVSFPHLEQLDLGFAEVTAKTLLKIVFKFPSLRGLSVWKVVMHDTSGRDERINMWANVFKRLADCTNLNSMQAGCLSHQKVLGQSYPVMFRDSAIANAGEIPPQPDTVRKYSGGSMTQFLEQLATDTFVLWPDPMPGDDDDSGESSDGSDIIDD